jgi:hypothetical protein
LACSERQNAFLITAPQQQRGGKFAFLAPLAATSAVKPALGLNASYRRSREVTASLNPSEGWYDFYTTAR